jgi:hypothetical protein
VSKLLPRNHWAPGLAVIIARSLIMRGSKKTSEPTTASGRWAAIKHILDGKIPIQDVLDAAQQLQAQRGEKPEPVVSPVTPPWIGEAIRRKTTAPAAASKLYEPWLDDITRGPADLIRYFAVTACYERQPELVELGNDDDRALVLEAVEFAADVAVRLAGVSESWADGYRALIAALCK